ncbi:unnamed protein product [Cyprideis torosa]|uniref:Calcineurin-like phosphoesterase domain-containing protein n=1 Tax=Cyprideis torosa TaxID=163714 RepID=A0A7R8ZK98_9CRUS|nr:unnamed protein product [Cyprideis torosa]CAG0890356.1 unnamed protein product [Cyprideis torosa]
MGSKKVLSVILSFVISLAHVNGAPLDNPMRLYAEDCLKLNSGSLMTVDEMVDYVDGALGMMKAFLNRLYRVECGTCTFAYTYAKFLLEGSATNDELIEQVSGLCPLLEDQYTLDVCIGAIKTLLDGIPLMKMLHISDTHFDPDYEEGSNAECGRPACCQSVNGPANDSASAAGKWGDYRDCDTPRITVENMLQHAREQHPDIDLIIWTGDLPPHDIWKQSKELCLDVLEASVEMVRQAFPETPVIPALGNHEPYPVNVNDPPELDAGNLTVSWLFEKLAVEWQGWVPEDQIPVLENGGFFSVRTFRGIRLISMNMNFGYIFNWFMWMDLPDPAGMLSWLARELQDAEDNGEKAYILGHIPSGSLDTLPPFSHNFRRIISRYENVVEGIFFGHTHNDEYHVYYDVDDPSRPVATAYIGPSVTPYSRLNPGYRIYYVDGAREGATWGIVDHETWVMNLDEANANGVPVWYKLYEAKQHLQLEDLSPESWSSLAFRLRDDDLQFDQFWL